MPIDVPAYLHQIQELQEQVIKKDKTVKMVHALYYLRSTAFTDEIQTSTNEKSDLYSKLQFYGNSIKQLTEERFSLRHGVLQKNQQRPDHHNRNYNNRRGGCFR